MDIYLQRYQKRGGLGIVAVPQRIFGGCFEGSINGELVRKVLCAGVGLALMALSNRRINKIFLKNGF
jgi:hypothetical protein